MVMYIKNASKMAARMQYLMTIISVISIWFTLNTKNITSICILGDFD